jgi:hypothetical protein
METHIEYRVRPVTRYVVTRWEGDDTPGNVSSDPSLGSRQIGSEYANADTAYEVAYALARQEHERLGYPLDDMRIRYPEHPARLRGGIAGGGPLAGLSHDQIMAQRAATVVARGFDPAV